MKNLFNTYKTPMEQMSDSLDMYSDPCASFTAEGPRFSFGKETLKSTDTEIETVSEMSMYNDSMDSLDEPTMMSDMPNEISIEMPLEEPELDSVDDDEDNDDLGIPETEEDSRVSKTEEVIDKIETIQTELDDLKSMLGEGTKEMFNQAFNILAEEFGGQVVPTSGEVNGVPVVEKYQDPTSGEVFVKAEDDRIFCVTIGFGGKIEAVKRTSYNPMIPEAYVRTDSNAISALGIKLA